MKFHQLIIANVVLVVFGCFSSEVVAQFLNPTLLRVIEVPAEIDEFNAVALAPAGRLWTRDNADQKLYRLDRITGQVLECRDAPDGSGPSHTDLAVQSYGVETYRLYANGDGEIISYLSTGQVFSLDTPITEGARGMTYVSKSVSSSLYVAGTSDTLGTGIFELNHFNSGVLSMITNEVVEQSISMAHVGTRFLLLLYPDFRGENYMIRVVDAETGDTIEDHLLFSSTANVTFGIGTWDDELYVTRSDFQEIHVYDIAPVGSFPPDSVVSHRGIRVEGDLASILVSDQIDLIHKPGIVLNTSEVNITLDFYGTSPISEATTVSVTIESDASTPGLGLNIKLFNFNTNSFDLIEVVQQHSFNNDIARTFFGEPENHIDPDTGQMIVRYEVPKFGFPINFPYFDRVDKVQFQVEK